MATVSSIVSPSKSQGSKISRLASVYNHIIFIFNFEDVIVTDKFQMKVVFADTSESTIYTYSIVNATQMRRDVAPIIKKYLEITNPLSILDAAFDSDTDASVLQYKVLYRFVGEEGWSETAWHYASNGVFQLGHVYDGNFLEQLAVYDNEGSRIGDAGKFLTRFDKPVRFSGYPFYLAFFDPIELNDQNITEISCFVNGEENEIGTVDGSFVRKRYVSIEGDLPVNNAYISKGGSLGEDVFDRTFDKTFWGTSDEDAFEIIERKYYEKRCTDTFKDPICLVWMNSLGGWDMWVFNKPTINTRYSDNDYAESPIDSLLQTDFGKLLNRDAIKSITVTEPKIDRNRYEALQEIISNPNVYWRVRDNYYMQVKVDPGSFQLDTNRPIFDFTVEFKIFKEYVQF